MKTLNRVQTQEFAEFLDEVGRVPAEGPSACMAALLNLELSRRIAGKDFLASNEYSRIVAKALDEVIRPEYERLWSEVGAAESQQKPGLAAFILTMQTLLERQFDKYCDDIANGHVIE